MMKFKVGDTVRVTSGKDRGREAVIEAVLAEKSAVVLPGINMYKKHIKASVAADKKGGIYDIPRPVNVAKVALICPNCKKQTRVGFRVEGEAKNRYCKKCDRVIDNMKKTEKKKKK